MSNEQQQNQKLNPEKVNQKFKEISTKLDKVFGEASFSSKVKVGKEKVESIVGELLAERQKDLEAEVKTEFKALISKRVENERAIKKMREEFEKSIATKQQEFINAANSILSKIDSFEEDKADFEKAVNDVAQSESTTENQEG